VRTQGFSDLCYSINGATRTDYSSPCPHWVFKPSFHPKSHIQTPTFDRLSPPIIGLKPIIQSATNKIFIGLVSVEKKGYASPESHVACHSVCATVELRKFPIANFTCKFVDNEVYLNDRGLGLVEGIHMIGSLKRRDKVKQESGVKIALSKSRTAICLKTWTQQLDLPTKVL
jgi:hypothetical protein